MPKDPFKTRLEIAKKKALKRNLDNKKHNPSPIGRAFKLTKELTTINKLAFVNDISKAPTLISGPIL